MELIRPPCGDNLTAHAAHPIWPRDGGMRRCPGWSQADADACALGRRLIVAAEHAYLDYRAGPDAPMVTLTCHPSVTNDLLKVASPGPRERIMGRLVPPEIQVEVTTDMPEGGWRLTLASGTLSDDASIPAASDEKDGTA